MAGETYNPLDKLRLGESVAKALLARPVSVLPPSEPFVGAGIYTLYYTGPFAPYRRIKERNLGIGGMPLSMSGKPFRQGHAKGVTG